MRTVTVALIAALCLAVPTPVSSALPCVGLAWPTTGPIVWNYAPQGAYAGHWGIDIGATDGTPIRAGAAGVVTFAGHVVDNETVTISHGGGLKTSYSYLSDRAVYVGQRVADGQIIGYSGQAHATAAVHVSVRVNGDYVDPNGWFGCHQASVTRALRLVK